MPEISKGGAEMVRSVKRSEGETTGRFSVGDAGQHENRPETLQLVLLFLPEAFLGMCTSYEFEAPAGGK